MSFANVFILEDCVVTINGVDFTDHCSSVEVAFKTNGVDITNFASGGNKSQKGGLGEDMFTVELQQDYSASEVDQTLAPLAGGQVEFPVTVQAAAGSISATNPSYAGTCILLEYTPLTGKPGSLATVKLSLPTQTGITRATS